MSRAEVERDERRSMAPESDEEVTKLAEEDIEERVSAHPELDPMSRWHRRR